MTAQEVLPQNIDSLIVTTYTTRQNAEGFTLSKPSEICAIAAQHLARTHPKARILIAGERTHGPGTPSTGEVMRDFLSKDETALRERTQLLDPPFNLINTPLQMSVLANHCRDLQAPDSSIALVCLGFHSRRIERYNRSFKLGARILSAETVLEVFDDHSYDNVIPALKDFVPAERKLELFSRLDRHGKALTLISNILGPRAQDIAPKPNDPTQYQGVNSHVSVGHSWSLAQLSEQIEAV